MKVRFIKSPVGEFNLAYASGTEAEMPDGTAQMLIDAGYAEQLGKIEVEPKVENMESKVKIETPEKKKINKK